MKIKTALFFLAWFILLFFPTPVSAQTTNKRIEIDLTTQRLYAYQGDQLVYSFLVSTGRWSPTPTGTFYPYWKTSSIRMIGGDRLLGTYYDLPNVPYDVFFYQGYAIHGTYWHNNFGHPMSHGCINMRTAEAALIYNWIDFSTPISIYGTTPVS